MCRTVLTAIKEPQNKVIMAFGCVTLECVFTIQTLHSKPISVSYRGDDKHMRKHVRCISGNIEVTFIAFVINWLAMSKWRTRTKQLLKWLPSRISGVELLISKNFSARTSHFEDLVHSDELFETASRSL